MSRHLFLIKKCKECPRGMQCPLPFEALGTPDCLAEIQGYLFDAEKAEVENDVY
jgi:hypothetical protein